VSGEPKQYSELPPETDLAHDHGRAKSTCFNADAAGAHGRVREQERLPRIADELMLTECRFSYSRMGMMSQ
jgi:hypothetical protein